ncbi:hypothetical protein [Amycolatopsis thermoflava]|uniref:hypothetical protein n=1 Tax=Amycolatopsis thermoflava TaxID=84480 RepID=UPI003F49ED2D
MDLSDTIAPTSDQLDAVDLLSGPRTFTVKSVSRGNAEQPVNIALVEFPRPWRPGKSMRRVLVACWGADASKYVGRRVTLYCDPDVRFGGAAVGGTRISHLSHLDKPRSVPLLVSRGKSEMFRVLPLVETPETRATNERSNGKPVEERVSAAVATFGQLGVTVAQLETKVGKKRGSWTPSDLARLQALHATLKRGEVRVEDEFPPEQPAPAPGGDLGQLDPHDPDLTAHLREGGDA